MTEDTNWELRVVENMGEVVGSVDSEDVVVPTKTLITDMKAQDCCRKPHQEGQSVDYCSAT